MLCEFHRASLFERLRTAPQSPWAVTLWSHFLLLRCQLLMQFLHHFCRPISFEPSCFASHRRGLQENRCFAIDDIFRARDYRRLCRQQRHRPRFGAHQKLARRRMREVFDLGPMRSQCLVSPPRRVPEQHRPNAHHHRSPCERLRVPLM